MKQNIVRWVLLVLLTCLYVALKYNGLIMPSNIISIFMGILLFFLPLKEKIYALLFFIPFYLYIYVFSFAFYNVISLLTLFHMIIVGKKFDIRIIMLVAVLFGVDIFWQIYVGHTSFSYTIKWVLTLFLSFTIMKDEEFNFDKKFALFAYCLGTAIISVGTIIQYIGVDINSITRGEIGGALSSCNANTFSFYCLLALVGGVYLILNKNLCKNSIYENKLIKLFILALSSISGVAGAMMLSKAYFLTFIIWLVLLIAFNAKDMRKFGIYFGVTIAMCIFIMVVPKTRELVLKVINRFNEKGSSLSEITTGRTDIFKYYFIALFNHPLNLMFGAGLSSYQWLFNVPIKTIEGMPIITHNLILEMVCSYGIVGMAILLYVYYKIITKYCKSYSNLNDLMLLIIFICFSLSLALYHEDVTNFVILLCMIAAKNAQYVKKEEQIQKASYYIVPKESGVGA